MSAKQQDLIPEANQFGFGAVIESQADHPGWLGNPAVIAKLIAGYVQKLVAFSGPAEDRGKAAWGFTCQLTDVLRGMDPINYPPTVLHDDIPLANHLLKVYGESVGTLGKHTPDQIIRTAVLKAIKNPYVAIVEAKGDASVTNTVRNMIDSAARVLTGLPA